MKNIGIYGGSFNPVHVGHVLLAREALETLSLDEVRLIPAARNPFKTLAGQAPAEDRLEMLKLAVEGEPGFVVDPRELSREGPSYTVDTLRELTAEFPRARFFLIIGQDQLTALERWREIEEILRLATPVVIPRSALTTGEPLPRSHALLEGREVPWLSRVFDLSATEVRNRVASGRNIRYLVPDKVMDHIHHRGLYNTL
jgi:nicotinate-nucleotide adenylyltransferase